MILAGEEVDDAVEVAAIAHRDLHRHHLGREVIPYVGKHALEVRVLLVHAGDEDDPGQVQPVADLPHLLGADFDPRGSRNHHHGGIGRIQPTHRLAEVVEVSGGVDHVDLGVHPLGVGQAEADGVLAFDLVGGGIGEGGAVLDRPVAPAGAGYEGKCIHQGGFSARSVAHKCHVANSFGAIDLHGRHLLR